MLNPIASISVKGILPLFFEIILKPYDLYNEIALKLLFKTVTFVGLKAYFNIKSNNLLP